jgi:hypothetical protein
MAAFAAEVEGDAGKSPLPASWLVSFAIERETSATARSTLDLPQLFGPISALMPSASSTVNMRFPSMKSDR